jgi:agmatine/peptidylarginine deiminase
MVNQRGIAFFYLGKSKLLNRLGRVRSSVTTSSTLQVAHRGQPNYCDCYLNFLHAERRRDHALVRPDQVRPTCARSHSTAFPDRQIVPIRLDAIASGGGLMHGVTQQEPAASA